MIGPRVLWGFVVSAEEAQGRGRAVERRRPCAVLGHMHLEAAYVICGRRVGGSSQKLGKLCDMADIVAAGRFTEFAHCQVLEHPAAKFADGLLKLIGEAPVLRLEVRNTFDPQDGALSVISFPVDLYLSPRTGPCAQRSPAVAGSFTVPGTDREAFLVE